MKKLCVFFAILLLFLTSCASKPSYQSSNFFVMDTFAEVRVYGDAPFSNDALIACKQLAEALDSKLSATREGSDTYAFNRSQTVDFSKEFLELTQRSLAFSHLTGGFFDATMGSLITLWKGCEAQGRLPTESETSAALHAIGYENIQISGNSIEKTKSELMLDFGAVGKGYASDKMAELLKEKGISCGMISFVSSLTVFGDRDFKIGIRCPDISGELCGYVTLRDQSLSVSGDYERFYEIGRERYPHILNPKTGKPSLSDLHSVVVIADSGTDADALSTAIFVMGIEKASELYQKSDVAFEFLCIIDTDMIASEGFLAKFETCTDDYRLLSISQYISEQ